MSSKLSLAVRALLSIALMFGFYVMALGIAGGLLYLPYAVLVYGGRLYIRLVILSVVAADLILYSIVPRRDRFVPPGPLLEPSTQPRLLERLAKLSSAIGQRMPGEVYLIADLNAWVSERGGIMGFGSRRVMGVGLPLMQVLTTSQFEAVLAHEFGHYHGGDTRLGPWIHKTRTAIARILLNLAPNPNDGFSVMTVIQAPFRCYGYIYLRVTLAISRAQEFAADRLAARIIGSAALIEGLRTIHRVAVVSNRYLQNEFLPAVRLGFRPPLIDGFALFLASERIAKFMDDSLTAELASANRQAYDTHPPLKDRTAALQASPTELASDETPALTLLDKLEDLEAELAASWLLPGASRLKPLAWSETGGAVLLPQWQAMAKRGTAALAGVDLENLYSVVKNLDPFARKLNVWASGIPWQSVRQYALSVLGAALACALHRRGWTIQNSPGELWLTNGDMRLNPFRLIAQIQSGELKEQNWNDIIAGFGLEASMAMTLRPVSVEGA